jgi:hypothetical protein
MLFKRVAEAINVAPLVQRLDECPELWGEITARQEAPGSPHKDTEAIFLRWVQGNRPSTACSTICEAVDYPAARS